MTNENVAVPGPARRRSPAHRPRVVFADLGQWDAFLQFAAALRRRGIRVERVTVAPHNRRERVRRVVQGLLFDRTDPHLRFDPCSRRVDLTDVAVRLDDCAAIEAVDVVAEALTRLPGHRLRTSRVELDAVLYDKLAMTRHAESLGIGVPETWDAPPLEVDGWLVVKRRLGSGGTDVRVARDRHELAEAWADTGGDGLSLVQRHVRGAVLNACGVARNGEFLQAGCYEMESTDTGWLGPARQIDVVDDPEVVEAARVLIADLGYTGVFCVQFVRPATGGRPLWIDFNSRVFGSWLVLQRAGLDIVGAYLVALGLADGPVYGHARPASALASNPHRPVGGWSAAAVRELGRVGRVLGPRWLVATSAETISQAAYRFAQELPGRFRRSRVTAAPHARG